MVDFEPREHAIRADLGLLKEARDFAERAAADFGLDGPACYDVKLAMSEAVTNAIKHGSSSPKDPIRILVLAEGASLVFEVIDTGRFVPRKPRAPAKGRGPSVRRRRRARRSTRTANRAARSRSAGRAASVTRMDAGAPAGRQ